MAIDVALGEITLTYGLDSDGDRATAIQFSQDIDRLTAIGMLELAKTHLTEWLMYGPPDEDADGDDD